jgi:hypothetical protein
MRAHEAVANCQEAIREWLDSSMRNACEGPCDYRNPRNVRERRDRKEAIEERLMESISDKIQPKYYHM